ncbi:FbpB family small basic protein [Alkalihalobacillus trypoxylicola]|nr:FbpB family small basic protein [Alkalihalobacillus trypoxylicola]
MRRQFITLEELIEKNKENLLNDPEALSEIEKRIDERNEQTYKDNK